MKMGNTYEDIARRSSTRFFTEEKIPEETLRKLVEAGLMGPTAANRQEIHFTVVPGGYPVLQEMEDEMYRLWGKGPSGKRFYYDAPAVIFLSGDGSMYWSPVDAGIAVENIALAAEDLGLGSLIIGCVKDALRGEKEAYFSKQLGFPEGYRFEVAIAVGYKAANKEPHTYDYESHVTVL